MADLMELLRGADRIVGGGSPPVTPYITMGSSAEDDQPLLEEYETLRSKVFNQYLASMAEDERFYRLEFGQDLIPQEWRDRGFLPTLPPTAYNAVEAAANHVLTTPDILVPERPTENDALREQAIASLKSTALLYFWHQVFKQGDPLGHAKKDLIKWGKIVLKKVIDYDSLDDRGIAIGARKFPWCVYQCSPSQVFEVGDPYDPTAVYEAYETTKAEAEVLFPDSKGKWRLLKKSLDKVRVLEYWEKPRGSSRGRRVVWIEDERVLNKPNPYHRVAGITDSGASIYEGYVPYFIADSGWGDGDTTAAPHERYVGMIRRVHSLLRTEARQLTAADAQLRVGTFPLIKLQNIEEDDEQPIQLGPGAKIHLGEDQDIAPIEWPRVDPGLFAIITRVHQYTNELAQFQALSGIPQMGVDSATEADQNFRAASAKLSGILSGLKSVITRMSETVLWDIEHIFEAPITLHGAADGTPGIVTIKPEYIDGFYECFVELKTSDQRALDAANAVRWANLYQTFGLDKKFAMKMAGIPNPQQRIAQRMQEDVLFDPRMHELRVALALSEQGGEWGQQLAMNVLQQMLNGVPPDRASGTAGTAPAESEGGGFPAPPAGTPTARDNPGAQTQGEQEMIARSTGFERARLLRPDLAFSG